MKNPVELEYYKEEYAESPDELVRIGNIAYCVKVRILGYTVDSWEITKDEYTKKHSDLALDLAYGLREKMLRYAEAVRSYRITKLSGENKKRSVQSRRSPKPKKG